jgi:ATP-GRASP peptide maturase of grasp-with-spasm system
VNGSDIDSPAGPKISVSTEGVKLQMNIGGVVIEPSKVKVVWFRRWAYNNKHRKVELFRQQSHHTDANVVLLNHHFLQELQGVSTFFFSTMAGAAWLGHPDTASPNKLEMMRMAAELGLEVPDTLVTTRAEDVRAFAAKHGTVVTKPLSDVVMCSFDDKVFGTYTSPVPESFLSDGAWLGSFPCLFQEKLEKRYEVRSFYLGGKFYSMAIFSQYRPGTAVDFRKYNFDDPARTVPYQLPAEVEEKLRALMQAMSLETGSVDIVRTRDGRYVFLEVNPNGQFGMVSEPCNYYLEKKVAGYLAEHFHASTE